MAGVQLAFKSTSTVGGNPGRAGPAMVKPKPGADGDGAAHEWPSLMTEREQKLHGTDQIRIATEQPVALAQRLPHQGDFAVFQIAQPAVNNAGRAAAGAGSKIILLHHGHFFAAAGTLPRNGDPVDTSADDQDIKALTVKRGPRWAGELHRLVRCVSTCI